MFNSTLTITGELHIILTGPDGKTKLDRHEKNLVVSSGKNVVCSRLTGNSTPVMSHMAIGTNSTATATAQTALLSENGRVALSTSGGVATDNVVTFNAVFGPGVGTGAVTEAGIFNAGVSGSMLSRTVFAVVNKDTLDTLTINWNITLA